MTYYKYQHLIFSFIVFYLMGIFFVHPVFSEDTSIATGLTSAQEKAIEDKKDKIDAINAKIKAYKQIIGLKQRQGSTLSDQITSLEAQANTLELEINANKEKIVSLEEEIHSLTIRILEKENLFDKQKEILAELMRVYYEDYSSERVIPIFSSTETLTFFNQENWTTQVGEKITEFLISIKDIRESLKKEKISVEEKKKEVDEIHLKLVAQEDYLENTKTNKASLLAKTQAEAKKYNSLVNDLQKQQEEIQQEIDSIEASKMNELTGLPSGGSGVLSYPVSKINISQGYGKTSYSSHYASKMHNGIDFAGSVGTPILSAGDGKVIGTGNLGLLAYGRWIAIDHGNGLTTLYGHLSDSDVSKGDTVKRGEKIGKMGGKKGSSGAGDSTGPHVHFTVYGTRSYEVVSYNGKPLPVGASINPVKYLP